MNTKIEREIAIALRKPFEELTPREVDLLWSYTSENTMEQLLQLFPLD